MIGILNILLVYWSSTLIDEAKTKDVLRRHLENIGYSWSNVVDVSEKKGVDICLLKPLYDLSQIEIKTFGNKDYLFFETFSVLEENKDGWKPNKNTLYTFVRCENKWEGETFKERVIGVKGLYLQKIYDKFEYKDEENVVCYRCKSAFSLAKIKFNGKLYKQRVQETDDCKYHSSCICVPLREIEDFLG